MIRFINKFILIVLVFLTFNCSKDKDKQPKVSNGFIVNDKLYETNRAIATESSPYRLVFYYGDRNDQDHFADFSLIIKNETKYPKLETGDYLTNYSLMKLIDDHHQIQFQQKNQTIALTDYWGQDSNFISGKVTVHDVTFSSDDPLVRDITFINIDYEFKWKDKTIIGNYAGDVNPWNSFTD